MHRPFMQKFKKKLKKKTLFKLQKVTLQFIVIMLYKLFKTVSFLPNCILKVYMHIPSIQVTVQKNIINSS